MRGIFIVSLWRGLWAGVARILRRRKVVMTRRALSRRNRGPGGGGGRAAPGNMHHVYVDGGDRKQSAAPAYLAAWRSAPAVVVIMAHAAPRIVGGTVLGIAARIARYIIRSLAHRLLPARANLKIINAALFESGFLRRLSASTYSEKRLL